jgi:hypothetical protein
MSVTKQDLSVGDPMQPGKVPLLVMRGVCVGRQADSTEQRYHQQTTQDRNAPRPSLCPYALPTDHETSGDCHDREAS